MSTSGEMLKKKKNQMGLKLTEVIGQIPISQTTTEADFDTYWTLSHCDAVL